jgi:5-methylcytosine-specific restriction endonuclease McrA
VCKKRPNKRAGEWRKAVFERDDYTCMLCGKRGGVLEAHHILPFAYYPELRYEKSNGQTMCRKCHDRTKIPYNKMRDKYLKSIKEGVFF